MSNLKARSNARKSSKVTTIRKAKVTTVTVRRDVMQEVTDKIVAMLETAGPWERPWIAKRGDGIATGLPYNVTSGRSYRGLNVPLLWAEGRSSNAWGTYRQWAELGAQVKKGEKGTNIIFWKKLLLKDEEAGEGEDENRTAVVARSYVVFCADQVDGYVAPAPKAIDLGNDLRNPSLDAWIANTKADIRFGGDSAYYHRVLDYVQVPLVSRFIATKGGSAVENFYSTVMHELVHWTGAATRLDRTKGKRFGDDDYSAEELAAEAGAAMLCATLGITATVREDHASYIRGWLKALKGDKRFLSSAFSAAQKAVDFLTGLQPAGHDDPGTGEDHDDESTPVEPEPAPVVEPGPVAAPVATLAWLDAIVSEMPLPGLCGPARKSRKPKREHAMFPAPVVETTFADGKVLRFSVFVSDKLERLQAIEAALQRGRTIAQTVYRREHPRKAMPELTSRIVVAKTGTTTLVDAPVKPRIRVAATSRQLELV